MDARIKEKELSHLNSSITAPILNITEEHLSLNVEGIGVNIPYDSYLIGSERNGQIENGSYTSIYFLNWNL